MTHQFVNLARVKSADGTELAVFEAGNPDGPVLVVVHGYPDNHSVWDGVAAELGDRYRVIAYDVRGAGESDEPTGRAPYKIARLTEDFRAVIDEVSPSAPVHLLAHDWGSIQSWGPVTDPAFADRIASFVSISGPSFDYCGAWFRDRKHLGASLRQLLHSYYMLLFQIPRLPERIVRLDSVGKGIAKVELQDHPDAATPVSRGDADLTNGINLYRANALQRTARPRPLPTEVPTLVLAPVDDPYVTPRIVSEAPVPYVTDLTVIEIPGSHWVVTARPDLIAMHVHAFIAEQSTSGLTPAVTEKAR